MDRRAIGMSSVESEVVRGLHPQVRKIYKGPPGSRAIIVSLLRRTSHVFLHQAYKEAGVICITKMNRFVAI